MVLHFPDIYQGRGATPFQFAARGPSLWAPHFYTTSFYSCTQKRFTSLTNHTHFLHYTPDIVYNVCHYELVENLLWDTTLREQQWSEWTKTFHSTCQTRLRAKATMEDELPKNVHRIKKFFKLSSE